MFVNVFQKVKMVIGVEMSQPAVDDAKVNAESNGERWSNFFFVLLLLPNDLDSRSS